MNGRRSNHWVLRQPDHFNKNDHGQEDPKSYLRQAVITSPVIEHTNMEEPRAAISHH